MKPAFYFHKDPHAPLDGEAWGWVLRDGQIVASWASWRDPPAPGCAAGARIEQYRASRRHTAPGEVPARRWRIVGGDGHYFILSVIDTERTAREMLAWLSQE